MPALPTIARLGTQNPGMKYGPVVAFTVAAPAPTDDVRITTGSDTRVTTNGDTRIVAADH